MPNCDSELVLGEGRYGLAKILLSLADFQDNFPGEAKERDIWWKLFVLAGVCWSLWNARNEWLLLTHLPKHLYRLLSRYRASYNTGRCGQGWRRRSNQRS